LAVPEEYRIAVLFRRYPAVLAFYLQVASRFGVLVAGWLAMGVMRLLLGVHLDPPLAYRVPAA
jgi:hypothetical protein